MPVGAKTIPESPQSESLFYGWNSRNLKEESLIPSLLSNTKSFSKRSTKSLGTSLNKRSQQPTRIKFLNVLLRTIQIFLKSFVVCIALICILLKVSERPPWININFGFESDASSCVFSPWRNLIIQSEISSQCTGFRKPVANDRSGQNGSIEPIFLMWLILRFRLPP